ncbi:MAG: hypothetical protein OHK0053_18670 [Microscillaceae bacterium]
MKTNVGNLDRIFRVVFAAVVALLFGLQIISGTLALVLAVAAGVLLLTSLLGFCPLYTLLGINTCPMRKPNRA